MVRLSVLFAATVAVFAVGCAVDDFELDSTYQESLTPPEDALEDAIDELLDDEDYLWEPEPEPDPIEEAFDELEYQQWLDDLENGLEVPEEPDNSVIDEPEDATNDDNEAEPSPLTPEEREEREDLLDDLDDYFDELDYEELFDDDTPFDEVPYDDPVIV